MKITITEKDIFSDLLFVLSTLLGNIAALPKIRSRMLKGCLTGSTTLQQKKTQSNHKGLWRTKMNREHNYGLPGTLPKLGTTSISGRNPQLCTDVR